MSASPTDTIAPSRPAVYARAGVAAHGVAEELEAILSAAARPRVGPVRRLRLKGPRRDLGPTREQSERSAGRIGALVAAIFLGVSAGAAISHVPQLQQIVTGLLSASIWR